jgi:hypothetical protein
LYGRLILDFCVRTLDFLERNTEIAELTTDGRISMAANEDKLANPHAKDRCDRNDGFWRVVV